MRTLKTYSLNKEEQSVLDAFLKTTEAAILKNGIFGTRPFNERLQNKIMEPELKMEIVSDAIETMFNTFVKKGLVKEEDVTLTEDGVQTYTEKYQDLFNDLYDILDNHYYEQDKILPNT